MQRIAIILGALYLASGCRRGTAEPPLTGPAPEWMEKAVHEQVAPLGSYQLLGGIFRGVAEEDEGIRWQVKLDQGECYAFSAVGSEGVQELKLYVFNPVGQRMFSKEGSNRVLASFCVTGQLFVGGGAAWGGPTMAMAQPGLYDVELKSTEGRGHVELGVFVQQKDAEPTAAPPESAAPPAADAPPQDSATPAAQ